MNKVTCADDFFLYFYYSFPQQILTDFATVSTGNKIIEALTSPHKKEARQNATNVPTRQLIEL